MSFKIRIHNKCIKATTKIIIEFCFILFHIQEINMVANLMSLKLWVQNQMTLQFNRFQSFHTHEDN